MTKTLYLGKIESSKVFCKIELSKGNLSITGVINPTANGDAESCGQIYDSLAELTLYAKGWSKAKVSGFVELWKKYHLNDMQAGCKHQRALDWTDYDKHPSEPCPVCGYKFGTEWKKAALPFEVVECLKSFPESNIPPAWI